MSLVWGDGPTRARSGVLAGPAGGRCDTRGRAGRILAIGGFSLGTRFDDLVLDSRVGRASSSFPTAAGVPQRMMIAFYDSFAGRAEPSHLTFNPWPPADLRELVLAQDAIYVSGGNTANALAIWRVHGFDAILREAWEGGRCSAVGARG